MKQYLRRFFSIGRSGWESYLAKIVKEERAKAELQVLNKTHLPRDKDSCRLHFANEHLLLLLVTDCDVHTINILVYIIPVNTGNVGATCAAYPG